MRRGEALVRQPESDARLGDRQAQAGPVVSNDANNRASATITIVPVTSNVERVYPFEVALAKGAGGLSKASKVQNQQIRTISRERISGRRIGALTPEDMAKVNAALRLHLSLDRDR